jgi:hypothetical protein
MTQLIDFTPAVFDFFGKRQFTYPVFDKTIFNGIASNKFTDGFQSICMSILEGNTNVNITKLRLCLIKLLLNDPNQVNNYLVNIYQNITRNIYEQINEAVINKTMTVTLFVDKYQLLYNTTKSLRKLLSDFDKNIIIEKDKKYSHIDLIRSYAIYRNIIVQKYNDKYLYEILCDIIKVTKNTQDIVHVYKIYKYYEKLSHTVNEEFKLFDYSINQKFNISTDDENNELTTNLFSEINNFILESSKQFENNNNLDEIKKKCYKIQDTVNMLEKITDKHKLFMEYYINLSNRLLSGKSNCYVEKNVLRFLPYKIDPELYQKMRFQINDIIDSQRIEKMAKQVIIKDTGKYDLSKFKKENCTFKVIRQYAWNTENNDQSIPSIEVFPYLDFFKKCYQKCYPEREITYDNTRSTGIITLSINEKEYLLHMTFSQIYVLLELNRNKLMSAYQLSTSTGIPLQILAQILNSFMFIKLIIRSNGSPNDPNVTFTINTNWSSPNDKISLVRKVDIVTNTQNDTLLYVSIINYIRNQSLNKNNLTKDDIYTKFNTNKQSDIDSILDKIVSNGHVTYTVDTHYKYIGLTKIDDESDDDFDESDDDLNDSEITEKSNVKNEVFTTV